MIVAATLALIAVSLAAIAAAAAADPKRRRAFGLAGTAPRHTRALAGLVLALSAAAVILLAGAAGVFVWLGAVLAAGRCLVALPPQRQAAMIGRLKAPWPRRSLPDPGTGKGMETGTSATRRHPMAESGLDRVG